MNSRMPLLFRAVSAAALLFLAVALTPLAWWAAQPLRAASDASPSDAIALFSSGQIDERWLTPDAAQRLLGALDLYRRGFAPVIVASGSQHVRALFQAELEASWLQRAGVPQDALVVEAASARTYESVVALRDLMAARGWRSVVVVTTDLDVPRIRLVCAKLGLAATFLGVPEFRAPEPDTFLYVASGYPLLYHAAYEYAAIAFYRFKGWL